MAGWNVDDQVGKLAFGDRLQVFTDRAHGNPVDKGHWFQHVPGLLNELVEAAAGQFRFVASTIHLKTAKAIGFVPA